MYSYFGYCSAKIYPILIGERGGGLDPPATLSNLNKIHCHPSDFNVLVSNLSRPCIHLILWRYYNKVHQSYCLENNMFLFECLF